MDIADGHCVSDLSHIYENPPLNRDNFLIWVIRHHITDEEDMPQHLHGLIEAWCGKPLDDVVAESWPHGLLLKEFCQRLERWSQHISLPELRSEACSTVFFDTDDGFSAGNAHVVSHTDEGVVSGEVALPDGCLRIRFDPEEGQFLIVSKMVCLYGGKNA